MARSYDEAISGRLARLSGEDREIGTIFERGYAIAMQVTALREKRHMTQAQLAEATGINQADISRIERGSVFPNEKTLLRIADALDAELTLVEKKSA